MERIPILYENDEICIINKVTGLAVQGGEGVKQSVDTVLAQQLGKKVYLVHRLDKETAGILVVAKSSEAAVKWTTLIASGDVKKEYIALCAGYPIIDGKKEKKGIIAGTLLQRGEERTAVTHFSVIKSATVKNPIDNSNIELSAVRLTLETGRMHQIRIQLASIAAPIIADDKHGDFKKNKTLKKLFGIKKLCLASVKLTLLGKAKLVEHEEPFEIELPEHIEKGISLLKQASEK